MVLYLVCVIACGALALVGGCAGSLKLDGVTLHAETVPATLAEYHAEIPAAAIRWRFDPVGAIMAVIDATSAPAEPPGGDPDGG